MRRLSRRLVSALAIAALAAATGAPAGAEEDSRTRSSPEHNVRLTIPEKWTWEDPSETDKGAGFVLLARRAVEGDQVTASARVRVVDAGGSSLESLLETVKDAKTKDLAGVTSEETSLEWAGVPARRMQINGKHEGGGMLFFEEYGAIVGGKFHQLDLRCVNGAEEKIREELNELAAAYALIDAPQAGGDSPAGEAPKQEFKKLGLTWTLPKPAQLPAAKEGEQPKTVRWGFGRDQNLKPDDVPFENKPVFLALAGIVTDEGGQNPVVVELMVQKAPVGMTAEGVAEHEPNFEKMIENFSDVPIPRVDKETEIGNLPAASRTLTGKDRQDPPKPLQHRVYFGVLKDWLFRVVVTSHDRAESTYRKTIAETMAGFHFEGAGKLGIRGPRISPIPSYTDVRPESKDDVGKEVPVMMPTLSLKKPPSFGRIKYDATVKQFQAYQFAAEARKEGAYAWVGILRWPTTEFTGARPNPILPESKIDELEAEWKSEMDEPVTLTQRAGKANKSPDGIAGGKGHGYEFRGSKEKVPFLEKGWVVKAGVNVFHVRVQYGGKDAEKALETDVKALLKSLKFGK